MLFIVKGSSKRWLGKSSNKQPQKKGNLREKPGEKQRTSHESFALPEADRKSDQSQNGCNLEATPPPHTVAGPSLAVPGVPATGRAEARPVI